MENSSKTDCNLYGQSMLLNCWWLLHEHLFCFSAYNLFVFQGSFPKTKHHSSVKCTTEGMFWWVHNKSTLDDYLGSSGSWKPQWMKDTPSATCTLHLAYNTNNKSSKLLPRLASAYWEHGPSAWAYILLRPSELVYLVEISGGGVHVHICILNMNLMK